MKRFLLLTVMCLLGFMGTLRAQETITVGEGTEVQGYLPSQINYDYTLAQMIYTAEDLQSKTGNITSFAFKNAKDMDVTRTFKVYMLNTDKASFDGSSDWVALQESDLVFEGEVKYEAKDAWTTVTFDTPFEYEEGKNVLLCVNDVTGAYAPLMMNYYKHTTTDVRSLVNYVDGSSFDATNITDASKFNNLNYVPQVQFTFVATEGGEDPEQPEDLAAPQNLVATSNGQTSITLTWDAVEGAASYNVYQGETLLANVTETAYTAENLEAYTEYNFAVTAIIDEVESKKAEVSAKTLDLAIEAPVVTITSNDPYSLNVTWEAVENALSYNIYQAEELLANVTETTYVVENLLPDTEYCFAVAAVRNETETEKVEACGYTAELDFDAEDLATEFFFDFNDQTFGGLRAIDADGDGNNWMISATANGYEDTYAIRSYSYYNYAAITPDNFIVTKVPYRIEASSVVTLNAKCGMGFDSDLNEHYAVVVSENGSDWTIVFEETIDHKEWTNTSVSLADYAGKGVLVGVRHYNCSGLYYLTVDNFALSTAVAAPEAPEVEALAIDETSVLLRWEVVAGATSYNVYEGTELLAATEETTYVVAGLAAGTNYCFNVAAVNAVGESEYAEACATTEDAEEDMNAEANYRIASESGYVYTYESESSTKVIAIDIEGVVDSLVYNDKGQVIAVNTYMNAYDEETGEEALALHGSNEYEYNEAGLLVTFNEFVDSWFGAYNKVNTIEYDSEGRIALVSSEEDKTEYTYNAEGLLAETVYSMVFGTEIESYSKTVYTYEDGRLVKAEYLYDYGSSWEAEADEVYEYDAEGNCISVVSSEYGNPWNKVRFKHNNVPAEKVYRFAYPHEILKTPVAPTHAYMLTKAISYFPDENGDFYEAFSTTVYNYEEYTTTPEIPNDVAYLIRENFDGFSVGDKIAEKGSAWWTTWDKKPGSVTDGVVAEINGNKCGYMTHGVDQVLLLGGQQSGVYDLEFDILVPEGKGGYFNVLHNFNGNNSTWAMQAYVHMTNDGGNDQIIAPGHGTVHAGGNSVADVACVYDEWMHFRLHVDTDADVAQYYYTAPGEEEILVCEWQWSMDSFGENQVGRKLDAMNFYPPLSTTEYYLDNFSLVKIGGESVPELKFNQESLSANMNKDDVTSVELSFENVGTSIAEYTAWVDYGMGTISENISYVNYDQDPNENTTVTGLMMEEPTEIEIGAMYPATSYGNSVAGTYITHMQYLFGETTANQSIGIVEGSSVTFRIYGQGLYGQPGEILAEKVVPYEEVGRSEWTTVEFDEPVALTGFNVWATVTFTQEVSTEEDPQLPFTFDGGEASSYGDLFRLSSNVPFWRFSEMFQESYGNFHLHMVCMGDPVLGGWAELDKVEGTLPIGATETITVDFSSIGLQKGETYEANIVFSTNIPENEVIEIPVSLYIWGEDIEENLSNVYNIYPNPTSGQVVVEGENINYIAVYNTFGQLVKVVKTQDNIVDMSAYENGVYYFNVVDNAGQNSVQRVVVAK